MGLSGRVVVVTGGNRGLGFGLARGVARAGASVAIWARDEEATSEAVTSLQSEGHQAFGVRCDISSEDDVAAAVAATVDALGGIDALFANAGIAGITPFLDTTLAEWRRVMSVNLDGTMLCLREGARQMVEQGRGGALVVVSSTAAIHGAARMQAYGASKSAVLGLTRAVAVEMARHHIRCNALVPGWTTTDMNASLRQNQRFLDATTERTPVRRWAGPEDFEAVAAYLADPSVTFHTGDTLVLDGGYTVF